MGRTKGRHHNEEVRLRDVLSELCKGVWFAVLAFLRPATGRHHRGEWARLQRVTVAPVAATSIGMAEVVALSVRLAAAQIHTMAVRFE